MITDANAHGAASAAVQRIDWKKTTTRVVVFSRFFGYRKVKAYPFNVTYGGFTMRYHLTKKGVILHGSGAAKHYSPLDLTAMSDSSRITMTKRLNELPNS